MKTSKWIVALLAVMAFGLIAAGCGDDDETSTAAAPTSTEASDDSGTASSDASTPDDVYNACIDALAGTPAEAAGEAGCAAARDAFEQCAAAAEDAPEGEARDTAIAACQQSADAAVATLNAAS